MDWDLDPRWVMWKAVLLKVVWVPDEVVAPLEVVKLVPPLELLLVCWGYSDPEHFNFESVVAVVARVRFVSVVEMCFCARCGNHIDRIFFNCHTTRKEVSLEGSLSFQLCLQCPAVNNLLWLFLGK